VQLNAGGFPMVEFDKDDVEDIGLLKLDILGVRMQSTIAHAVHEIQRVAGEEIDIDALPLDDAATYSLIQSTRTLGIFQVESPGQRELVGKLEPRTFSDLIIDISLFRPGPVKSDMIRPFLNARHGWNPAQIIHSDLLPILSETEGVVVFHEQVISIISVMTGISLAAADEKRRALGDRAGQQEVCDWFFPAATERGYELKVITEIYLPINQLGLRPITQQLLWQGFLHTTQVCIPSDLCSMRYDRWALLSHLLISINHRRTTESNALLMEMLCESHFLALLVSPKKRLPQLCKASLTLISPTFIAGQVQLHRWSRI
jgi:hypothetical protein